MTAALRHDEASDDKGHIGNRGVRRRVAAAGMKITEGCRLVDQHAAIEVDRQRHGNLLGQRFGPRQHLVVGAVDTQGQRAFLRDHLAGELQAVCAVIGGDDESDGAEAFFRVGIPGTGIDLQQQRRAYTRPRELLETAPYGLSRLQSLFLFTRSDTIYGGSNEIQRNIIAERALGMPREPRVQA